MIQPRRSQTTSGPLPLARGGLGWGPIDEAKPPPVPSPMSWSGLGWGPIDEAKPPPVPSPWQGEG
ncbi:MAG: hypothetical protein ACRC8Y_14775 [Chroococcales cyanobacterium]